MEIKVIAVPLLLFTCSINAASFDCSKASTLVEKDICNNRLLSNLDDALSENYKYMLASNIGDGARKELKSTQREWLKTRNKCENVECLTSQYEKRVDEICDYPVLSGVHPDCKTSDEVKAETEMPNKAEGDQQKITQAQQSVAESADPIPNNTITIDYSSVQDVVGGTVRSDRTPGGSVREISIAQYTAWEKKMKDQWSFRLWNAMGINNKNIVYNNCLSDISDQWTSSFGYIDTTLRSTEFTDGYTDESKAARAICSP